MDRARKRKRMKKGKGVDSMNELDFFWASYYVTRAADFREMTHD